MKRKRASTEQGEGEESEMEIVWQTPANPPELHDYIFRNGRRHVKPYYFEFVAHVKNRWAGKSVVDMFTQEFKGRNYDYYVSAVKSGRIQVDGEQVPVSYILKSSQKISHFVHRHEPPVLALDVTVLHKGPDVVTVCKPASVPSCLRSPKEFSDMLPEVHPCGQYRKNTIVGILEAEQGLAPLFPIHRLDRLVSGLLIMARSASKADLFRQHIEGGKVHKQYIARVIGVFPEDEQVVDAYVNFNHQEGKSYTEVGNSCDGTPLKGKASSTKFTRISTNGVHSLVLCEPITGRTHQIRVHLQHIGYPIANDMLYISEDVTCRSIRGMGADRAAVVYSPNSKSSLENSAHESKENFAEDLSIDPMCTNCPELVPKGYEGFEEGLWLHCLRYSGPDWAYECPYPDWASLS